MSFPTTITPLPAFPTFEEVLGEGLITGRFRIGSQATVRELQAGQQLCSVNMPAHYARAWTLTFLKQRFSDGTPDPAGPAAGDPDSQFAVKARLRVEWGVDGAADHALVDYPASGATLTLFGATVAVRLVDVELPVDGSSASNPLLGAFLAPGSRSLDNARLPGPVLEQTVQLDPLTSSNVLSRPSHAVGYRILKTEDRQICRVRQVKNAVVLSLDMDEPIATSIIAPILYPWREHVIPLLAETTGIVIENAAPEDRVEFRVQWLLDLG